MEMEDAPVLVLADAFPAHWAPGVKELVARQRGVSYVAVPDSLTHLFQPLDLGMMKASIQRRKDEFMESEVATAIREGRGVVLSRSRPVLRNKVTLWIKEVVADPTICAAKCCKSGFARAGLSRLLYNDTDVVPDVDVVVPPPVCEECGELGQLRDELPVCDHFFGSETAVLCTGCLTNHRTLCTVSES